MSQQQSPAFRKRGSSGAAVTVVALLVVLIATPALSASGDRRGEVGFDLGRTNFASNVSDDSGNAFGLRGGYHFNKWFQLEAQVASTSADEQGAEATLSTVFVNSVFNFQPRPTIQPYVLAGLGRANLEFEAPSVIGPFKIDDNGAAYQVGAGSRFFFSKGGRIAARVEVSRLRERTFDESSNYTNVVTGLTWKLGARS